MASDSRRARIVIVELSENDNTNISELIRDISSQGPMNAFVIREVKHMGDTYNVPGQAGNVGPDGHVEGNTFQQQNRTPETPFDLPALTAQLETLRSAMKQEAKTAEHDMSIGAVAQAEVTASNGDTPGTLAHLKSAGEWALKMARVIGVEVAALAIAHSLAGG
ncbi:hypothetical protein [Streptomyces sp. NBC_00620]|uniref:hypothetical protein n=1 Tax=Streptomyces sp. NBC_00620 TaxID=2903666 RepID=UPI0022577949|nr:hypothetical protein [Streptomyces sp. NBC_00620]MCX4974511.1 hypothetical protein [Streptomyces sp. NBC_00620]